jgi:site-specific recombinase
MKQHEIAEKLAEAKEDIYILTTLKQQRDAFLAELRQCKTQLSQLRQYFDKCLCSKTMVHFCDRCSIDLRLDSIDKLLIESKSNSNRPQGRKVRYENGC